MNGKWEPAFDMPATPQQALEVIQKWGSRSCMTFSSERAQRCAELLSTLFLFDQEIIEIQPNKGD